MKSFQAISNQGSSQTKRRIKIWALAVAVIVSLLVSQVMYPELAVIQIDTPAIFFSVFFAALFCEFIDSSLGMGYGTTLTPLLLVAGFNPLQIVPCVLFSEFLTGISATVMHQYDGNVDLFKNKRAQNTALQLSLLSVIGTVFAVVFALKVPEFWLKIIISVIILSVGIVVLATIGRKFRYRPSHILTIGTIAAFNKAVSGGGYGPLVTSGQVVSGISPKEAVAITSLAEGLTCAVGFSVYWFINQHLDIYLMLPLTLGAMLSIPISTLAVKNVRDKTMRASVGVATCLLALLSIAKLF